jgi:hypothetical protein
MFLGAHSIQIGASILETTTVGTWHLNKKITQLGVSGCYTAFLERDHMIVQLLALLRLPVTAWWQVTDRPTDTLDPDTTPD